jgi:hypothetical protein
MELENALNGFRASRPNIFRTVQLATVTIQAQSNQCIAVVGSQLGNTHQSLVQVGHRLTARMIRRIRRNAAFQRLA